MAIFFLVSVRWFIKEDKISFEYWTNILLLFLTSLVFVTLENLFLIFLILEIQTFIVYFLVIQERSRQAVVSALRFFFQNVVVTFLFLMGLYFVYSGFESYDLGDRVVEDWFLFLLFFFKLGLFPFHLWILDLLKSTNKLVAYFLGIYLKFVYFFFFLSFVFL